MDEKLKQIDDLMQIAARRGHAKKVKFFAEVKKILEAKKENSLDSAKIYIKDQQKIYATRADVGSYEMMEGITAIKKIVK